MKSASRIPRSVRFALRIGAFVVGLPLGIWLILYAAGSWRLSASLASARQSGFATSLAELAPPPLPPERNAAVQYEAAFALHPDPRGEDAVLRRALDSGFAAVLGDDEKHVLEILEKSSALYDRLRAARVTGSCRYDRSYTGPLFNAAPSQAVSALRTAPLLKLKAQREIGAGRSEAARETVRDLFALANSFRDEPFVVSQIVRIGILGVGLEAVHESVTGKTGNEDLRAWLEVVPRPESMDGAMKLAYRGELAMGAELAGRPPAEALVAVDPSQEPPGWLARTSLLAPYWKFVGRNYLERMTRLVEASGKPYPEARAEFEAVVGELRSSKPYGDLLSLLLIPALEKPIAHQALSQARLAVIRTGLEWEIERAERGRYAEEATALDPLTGKPLRYEREAGRISSAGLGGKTAKQLEEEQLVWKLRHSSGK